MVADAAPKITGAMKDLAEIPGAEGGSALEGLSDMAMNSGLMWG